jgi:DNA-binding response OmpR family regulator
MLLKPKEFSMLRMFMQNEGKTLKSETIYERVWKTPLAGDNQTLRKHISELRKKLERGNSGYTITNIHSEGYRFEKIH